MTDADDLSIYIYNNSILDKLITKFRWQFLPKSW